MLAKDGALRLTESIKQTAESSAKEIAKLLIQAVEGRAWDALGFRTCADYLTIIFGEIPLRLSAEDRGQVFSVLHQSGKMSLREIAKVSGYSKDTVSRSLHGRVSNETAPTASDATNATMKKIALIYRHAQRISINAEVCEQLGVLTQMSKDLAATIKLLEDARAVIADSQKKRQQDAQAKHRSGGTIGVPIIGNPIDLDA